MKKLAAPLLLIPILLLSACTPTSEVSDPTASPAPSRAPIATPTPTPGQVVTSITAATGSSGSARFAIPAGGYNVQVLCEGDASAKLRVSVKTTLRYKDGTTSESEHAASTNCLHNKPYTLASTGTNSGEEEDGVLSLEVVSGTVARSSATLIAN